MTTSASDIAIYLAGLGRGTVGTTIFVNRKPSMPDAIICITDYAGQSPDRTNTNTYDKPAVQVLVRGARDAAATACNLAETLRTDLDCLSDIVLTSTYYQFIEGQQSVPTPMGQDENGRPEYVCNFYIIKTR
jgi:hypothetical protein